MRLIIGGIGQGKLHYTLEAYHMQPEQVALDFETATDKRIFYRFQQAVEKSLSDGKSPESQLKDLIQRNPDLIILCDEVGCGVVPINRKERHWREITGRLCCQIAEQAESVERVFCGLPMRLK